MHPVQSKLRPLLSEALWCAGAALILAVLFASLYALPISGTVLFVAGLWVLFYCPGDLLLRLLPLRIPSVYLRIATAVCLGMSIWGLLYPLLRTLEVSALLWPIVLVLLLARIAVMLKWQHASVELLHKSSLTGNPLILLCLVCTVLLLLHLSFFTDIIHGPQGLSMHENLNETLTHLSFTNALKYSWPAIYPFASGHDFSYYHSGMHLQMAMLSLAFSISTLDLMYYYFPLLYLLLAALLPFLILRAWGATPLIAALASLMVFSGGYEWPLAAAGLFSDSNLWTVNVHTNVFNLVVINGYTAALGAFFLSVLFLKHYLETSSRSAVALFILLTLYTNMVKTPFAVQTLTVTVVLSLLLLFSAQMRRRGAMLLGLSCVTLAFCMFDFVFNKGATTGREFAWAPLGAFLRVMKNLSIQTDSLLLLGVLLILYLLIAFGVRAFGFTLIRNALSFSSAERFDAPALFLILYSLSGIFLVNAVTIKSPAAALSAAETFVAQSFAASALLAAYAFMQWKFTSKRAGVALIILVLLSLPATVHLYWAKTVGPYVELSSDAFEVVEYLQRTPADSVVLHPTQAPDDGPSLSALFAGRQVVFSDFYAFYDDWVSREETTERMFDVKDFFDPYNSFDRAQILRKYGVDYVYAPLEHEGLLRKIPQLIQVLKTRNYVVYNVVYKVRQ